MIFPQAKLVDDFWRVNSYGYPVFFGKENARTAWETLLPFFEIEKYSELKKWWASSDAPRKIHAHTVESWKATFEEFGLLFVESGKNIISFTPAGKQMLAAAKKEDRDEFIWIGLNLLLRYPLRGPRGSRNHNHKSSDLLVYRFLYSALLDLDGYIWWSELEGILSRIFTTSETTAAIQDVLELRKNTRLINELKIPAEKRGAFYNSLNQVAVHASMNDLLLGSDSTRESIYGIGQSKRRQYIREKYMDMVRKALSQTTTSQCAPSQTNVSRLPIAPTFINEKEYFDYVGAEITPYIETEITAIETVDMQGEKVFILNESVDYRINSGNIMGDVAIMCQLSKGQRLILSHDQKWTYLLEAKQLAANNQVQLQVRRARPITNFNAILSLKVKGSNNG